MTIPRSNRPAIAEVIQSAPNVRKEDLIAVKRSGHGDKDAAQVAKTDKL